MKKLLIAILLTQAYNIESAGAETCKMVDEATQVSEKVEDLNSPARKELKNAVITVKLSNGKEYTFSANEFKVVKRQQQLKTVEKSTLQTKVCIEKQKDDELNLIALGARKDHVGVDADVKSTASGLEATISSEKALVLDAAYIRRKILQTPLGIGAGIDTNGTLKAIISTDF